MDLDVLTRFALAVSLAESQIVVGTPSIIHRKHYSGLTCLELKAERILG